LITALKDKSYDVRENAAEALGWIGDPRAIEPLQEALNDRHWGVKMKAENALIKIEYKLNN
jgi:HEAT repeat protein